MGAQRGRGRGQSSTKKGSAPPAAAGVTRRRIGAAKTTPAAPAPRAIRQLTANDEQNALVASWKQGHQGEAQAQFDNKLARSPIVKLFDSVDLDILHSAFGDIVAHPRRGQVDYKALAIAELGPARVAKLEASYRRDGTKGPQAPTAWRVELGLPELPE